MSRRPTSRDLPVPQWYEDYAWAWNHKQLATVTTRGFYFRDRNMMTRYWDYAYYGHTPGGTNPPGDDPGGRGGEDDDDPFPPDDGGNDSDIDHIDHPVGNPSGLDQIQWDQHQSRDRARLDQIQQLKTQLSIIRTDRSNLAFENTSLKTQSVQQIQQIQALKAHEAQHTATANRPIGREPTWYERAYTTGKRWGRQAAQHLSRYSDEYRLGTDLAWEAYQQLDEGGRFTPYRAYRAARHITKYGRARRWRKGSRKFRRSRKHYYIYFKRSKAPLN